MSDLSNSAKGQFYFLITLYLLHTLLTEGHWYFSNHSRTQLEFRVHVRYKA